MGELMYRLASLAAGENLRAPLEPPEQGDFWTAEPDIGMYHESVGTGRKLVVIHGGPGFPFSGPLLGLVPMTHLTLRLFLVIMSLWYISVQRT